MLHFDEEELLPFKRPTVSFITEGGRSLEQTEKYHRQMKRQKRARQWEQGLTSKKICLSYHLGLLDVQVTASVRHS